MIIVFNLILLITFFFKSFFFKNEFSLLKNVLKKFSSILYVSSNNFTTSSLFSLKKVIKLYKLNKLNNSFFFKFKRSVYGYFLVNNLKAKWYLNYSINNFKKNTSTQFNISSIPSKFNFFLKNNTISKSNGFNKDIVSNYVVFHKPSSFVKFIDKNDSNILFLRKNKIFNKGRYSRNRQLYRTGVYWCIWLSVFLGYCLYFSFYRFTFNFGYQWWLIFGFLFLFINQKMFKYNYYNLKILSLELKKNFNWLSIFIYNLFKNYKLY